VRSPGNTSTRRTRPILHLTTIIVHDYDAAIRFFTDTLGFDLTQDEPSTTNDGRPKRWVVVRPRGAETGILLAKADGPEQEGAVGNQHAGRVGFFLRVDDFDARYEHMRAAGVEFLGEPRTEPYGRVVVFHDIAGNKWDLLGSATGSSSPSP
jgi:catechol 2,3-dioxygenase-like lactoylglutathione lyase family enzyme